MTLNELFERIPTMSSVVYAQGRAIINYKCGRCEHVKMSSSTCSEIEVRLQQYLLEELEKVTRTKILFEPTKRKSGRKPVIMDKYKNDVIELYKENPVSVIAEKLGLKRTTVSNLVERLIKSGELIKKEKEIGDTQKFVLENIKTMKKSEMARVLNTTMQVIWNTERILIKKGLLK